MKKLLSVLVLLTFCVLCKAQSYNIDQITYSHTEKKERYAFKPLEAELYLLIDRVWIYYTDEAGLQTNVSYFIKKTEGRINTDKIRAFTIITKDGKQLQWLDSDDSITLIYFIKRSDGIWKVTYQLTQTS